jgi:hypothetical protein
MGADIFGEDFILHDHVQPVSFDIRVIVADLIPNPQEYQSCACDPDGEAEDVKEAVGRVFGQHTLSGGEEAFEHGWKLLALSF